MDLPPSHDLVHADQEPQPEIWQSIGQAWVLHAAVCSTTGQGTPPYAMEVKTGRDLIWRPPPQRALQALPGNGVE